jgi:hypothetical protein
MSALDWANVLFHVSATGAIVLMAYAIGWDRGYKRASRISER